MERLCPDALLLNFTNPEARVLDAIAFQQADVGPLREGQQVRMVYRLDSNEYRGLLGLQLVVDFIQPLDDGSH